MAELIKGKYETSVDKATRDYFVAFMGNGFQHYLGKESKDDFVTKFLQENSDDIMNGFVSAIRNKFKQISLPPYVGGTVWTGRYETDAFVMELERHIKTVGFDMEESKDLEFFERCKIFIKTNIRKKTETLKEKYTVYPVTPEIVRVSTITKREIKSSILKSLAKVNNKAFKDALTLATFKAIRGEDKANPSKAYKKKSNKNSNSKKINKNNKDNKIKS